MDKTLLDDLYRRSMAFGAPNEYERAHAEITRLRAELAECRRDAERYRWLKKVGNYDSAYQYAIDAARKGEEE